MNNENNNDIIFDTNNKPLDNSTVDYNKLYNVEVNQQPQQTQVQNQNIQQQINPQVQPQYVQSQINSQGHPVQNNIQSTNINSTTVPVEDQIINPVVTPLEQDNINEDNEPEKKKSFIFAIVIALIIIIAVMFLFPILFKKGF